MVDEIMLSCACSRFVFSAGSTQPVDQVLPPQSQSQDDDNESSSQLSQPLTDSWSQSNYGNSQPTDSVSTSQLSMTQRAASQGTPASHIPPTPTSAPKRSSSDDIEAPWSNKHSRTTGPELILALGHSVAGIGKVIETVFALKKSSVMSPTKKVEVARKMVLADMNNGYLNASEHTHLHILFGRDTTAADAYISDNDAILCAEIGRSEFLTTASLVILVQYHYSGCHPHPFSPPNTTNSHPT
ncbi:hypothetical protein C8R44DRAFT_743125 [Mycena epipterygia]|nr:hypothetical protein C8R44DRAFT_743125 [Mycena epipterygia]